MEDEFEIPPQSEKPISDHITNNNKKITYSRSSSNDRQQELSSSPQGIYLKPEGKQSNDSYLPNLSSYLNTITPYLPPSIKKQLPVGKTTSSGTPEEKDIITWASFDFLVINGQQHQILILSYMNGFQIWDIQDPLNVHEILSKREGPIKCVKVLPTPLKVESENHPFYNKRPLLAIASANTSESSSFPSTMIKLYSLRTNEYVNMLRFRTDVFNIIANQRVLVVVLKDHIYVFDSVSMEKLHTLNTYPNIGTMGVVALGSRWIAYPGNQPILTGRNQSTSQASASDKLVEVAKDVAKDLASGLFYFGKKTFQDYIYNDNTTTNTSVSNNTNINNTIDSINNSNNSSNNYSQETSEVYNSEYAGTVIVFDIFSGKVVAHFQAQSQAISAMAFDPTGTLLVTSSIEGHNFHVFKIGNNISNNGNNNSNNNNNNSNVSNHCHLYKLQRGLTNATVLDISFSPDSRYVAITTTRGTTHIFAITPTGGNVTIYSHLKQVNKTGAEHIINVDNQYYNSTSPIVQTALYRIKTATLEELINPKSNICISSFTSSSLGGDKLYVVSQSGNLIQYQLFPQKSSVLNSDFETSISLELNVDATYEWDVARHTKWAEIHSPYQKIASNTENNSNNNNNNEKKEFENDIWLSQVEILTHTPYLRPLWASPQFTFKTFKDLKMEQEKTLHGIKYETIPTCKIEVLHNDPIPFNSNEKHMREPLYSHDQLFNPPSAPPISEDLIKENLTQAMSTLLYQSNP